MNDIKEFLTALEDWFLSDNEITDITPSTNEQ
jgi:hypothetical protein